MNKFKIVDYQRQVYTSYSFYATGNYSCLFDLSYNLEVIIIELKGSGLPQICLENLAPGNSAPIITDKECFDLFIGVHGFHVVLDIVLTNARSESYKEGKSFVQNKFIELLSL